MQNIKSSFLVFSTDTGRCCPLCRQGIRFCRCKEKDVAKKKTDNSNITLSCEQNSSGKKVTKIIGLPLNGPILHKFISDLRKCCNAAVYLKSGKIEIQGDHVKLVLSKISKDRLKIGKISLNKHI